MNMFTYYAKENTNDLDSEIKDQKSQNQSNDTERPMSSMEFNSFGGNLDLYKFMVFVSWVNSCCCCCFPELIGDCVQGNAFEGSGIGKCLLRLMCCQYPIIRQNCCLPLNAASCCICICCYKGGCCSLFFSCVRIKPSKNTCFRC